MQTICIIGTDTAIGKTYSCCRIMEYLAQSRQQIGAIKPIATGVGPSEYGLLNEDVYQLYKANNYSLTFEQINPYSFDLAVAPHIAAQLEKRSLRVAEISRRTTAIINQTQCNLLIEGVGGLMVPLNMDETYLDLLIRWNYPIILIVGMKLGCLNHTLLTVAILKQNNLSSIGWIANQLEPQMACYTENLDYLIHKLQMPLLATIPHQGQLQPRQAFKELFQCR